MNRKRYIFEALLVILVLVAGWFGVQLPNPPTPEPVPWTEMDPEPGTGTRSAIGRPIQFDRNVKIAQDLSVVGDADVDSTLTVDGASTLTGAVTVGSNLAVTGSTTLTGGLILASTAITLTAGQVITPAYGMYIISSSGSVSMTLAAPSAAGRVLYLYGDDANTVTINDTNIRSTDGNAVTFGQYDVVQWISTATEWIHVSKSADQ